MNINNPFNVGDHVMHNVEIWKQPTSMLTVTHVKKFAVAAIDDSGNKFVGNFGCFDLIKRGANA